MYTLGTVLVYFTALGALLFVSWYGVSTPWFRTAIGRSLMAMSFSLLLIFGITSITLFFGTQWPWRLYLRATVAAIACFSVWSQLIILTTIQIRSRRTRHVEQVR